MHNNVAPFLAVYQFIFLVYPVSNCVGRGPLVLGFPSVYLDADTVWFQLLGSAHLVEPYGCISL